MYAKLVFRNAKRSVKDYLIYMMAVLLSLPNSCSGETFYFRPLHYFGLDSG